MYIYNIYIYNIDQYISIYPYLSLSLSLSLYIYIDIKFRCECLVKPTQKTKKHFS